ncbi:FAD-dependent oxidoreductase, partial [Salmonella enterica]|uniref:FAD-dependent oxidoreductase n=1 Tax=Salmonella enterica TaxID=28901 RepID=UPI00398C72ED
TRGKAQVVISQNHSRGPIDAGGVARISPCYCPSVEDKVLRFDDRNQHQVFLEPEGLTSNEIYPTGISTSLPFDVHMHIVRSMPGMENAKIVSPGSAILSDFFHPRALKPPLVSKVIPDLSFACQLNGPN